MCCTLAISGVPFFSGYVSKDRILGDAWFWATQSDFWGAFLVPVFGYITAFLTAFYMFRMMFLAFYGTPRDKDVYDHCHKETLQFNRNVPLLILAFFTLGLFYCGSFTGQKIVKVFPKGGVEWFKTLIETPDKKHLSHYKSFVKLPWKNSYESDDVDELLNPSRMEYVRTYYDPNGYNTPLAKKRHHIHVYGAILSLFIALGGIGFAFLMYMKGSLDPNWWSRRLSL